MFRRPAGSDDPAENVLATNDTLRQLWVTPEGGLWVASSAGLVWTTAAVAWSGEMPSDLEFDAPEGGLTWHHTELPVQEHNGARPNPTALWGSCDQDMHVATFGGVLYHWGGAGWSQWYAGRRFY